MVDRTIQSAALTLPSETRRALTTGAGIERLRRHHQEVPAIQQALRILLDNGCSPVVLKGVDLAHTRYPTPEHRTFADLDLLLPEHQLTRANQVLRAAGFVEPTVHHVEASHHHLPPPLRAKADAPDRASPYASREPLPVPIGHRRDA